MFEQTGPWDPIEEDALAELSPASVRGAKWEDDVRTGTLDRSFSEVLAEVNAYLRERG